LAKVLHRQIGPLTGAVPVDEIAFGLGISEVRQEALNGCEGVLLTDLTRSQGRILVNTGHGPQAARFSIAHELGHFLLERHVLGLDGRFTCSLGDLRETRTVRQRQRQEVEANTFAIDLLVPDDQIAPFLKEQPDIRSATELRGKLDISLEAATRCLVDRREEPISAVWTVNGKIRYAVRGNKFPWLTRKKGELVSSLTRTASALAKGSSGITSMAEVAPATWTTEDIPELFEQIRVGHNGHALTLLWATLPDTDEEAGDED
jgi:Zn-dependent peptidase ImmA (M78 family)